MSDTADSSEADAILRQTAATLEREACANVTVTDKDYELAPTQWKQGFRRGVEATKREILRRGEAR